MKLLKLISLTLLTLLVVSMAGLFVVWMNPGVLLSSQNLSFLQKKVAGQFEIDWENIEVDASSPSFWRKKISVVAKDACFKEEPVLLACFKTFQLNALVDLSSWQTPRLVIERLEAEDEKIQWQVDSASSENGGEEDNLLVTIQEALVATRSVLRMAALQRLNIHLTKIEIPGDALQGMKIKISSAEEPDSPLLVDFSAQGVEGFKIQGEIGKADYLVSGPWQVNADYFDKKNNTKLVGAVRTDVTSTGLENLSLKADLWKRVKSGQHNIDFTVNVDSQVDVRGNNGFLKIKNIRISDRKSKAAVVMGRCEFSMGLVEDELGKNLSLDCPDNYLELKATEIKRQVVEPLPDRLKFSLNAKMKQQKDISYQLKFVPYRGAVADFSLSSRGVIGLPFDLQNVLIESLQANLKIKKYQGLVDQLKMSFGFLIPVPFNRLNGIVSVTSEVTDWRLVSGDKIPIKASLDLSQENTTLKANYNGFVLYQFQKGTVELGGEAVIDEMKFVLPSFDPLYGFPSLTADSRIRSTLEFKDFRREVAEVSSKKFSYRIKVRTKTEDSIKLYYYLAHPYIPVVLNLVVADGKVGGEIDLRRFRLTYLKKSISVEALQVKIDEELKDSTLNAVFTAQRGAYSLRLELVGAVDEPQIYLSSQPDLSSQEILALLLYNKMPSHLSEQQNQDTSELNAALSDHAIGLLGAWALSSVPIDSISYNPTTKTYSAQVNLPSDLTLSIGSDWENVTGVELAKRVGMNWFLVSTYEPSDEKASEGRMMLEWRKAY